MRHRTSWIGGMGLALLALLQPTGRADQPEMETLPAPQAVQPEVVVPLVPTLDPLYLRTSRYGIWQVMGVDFRGNFRPRVALAPYGEAFYLYNGKPYPWVSTHALDVMPYIVE